MFFFCLAFVMPLCARLFICALWSPAGKGLPLGSRLWCLTVKHFIKLLIIVLSFAIMILNSLDSH